VIENVSHAVRQNRLELSLNSTDAITAALNMQDGKWRTYAEGLEFQGLENARLENERPNYDISQTFVVAELIVVEMVERGSFECWPCREHVKRMRRLMNIATQSRVDVARLKYAVMKRATSQRHECHQVMHCLLSLLLLMFVTWDSCSPVAQHLRQLGLLIYVNRQWVVVVLMWCGYDANFVDEGWHLRATICLVSCVEFAKNAVASTMFCTLFNPLMCPDTSCIEFLLF